MTDSFLSGWRLAFASSPLFSALFKVSLIVNLRRVMLVIQTALPVAFQIKCLWLDVSGETFVSYTSQFFKSKVDREKNQSYKIKHGGEEICVYINPTSPSSDCLHGNTYTCVHHAKLQGVFVWFGHAPSVSGAFNWPLL